MRYTLLFSLFICSIFLCSCKTYLPVNSFEAVADDRVDYADLDHWAAHPDKVDLADKVPGSDQLVNDEDQNVDVFFIHPTTYTGKKGHDTWNADINDKSLNERTDGSTILYQASIFNQAGRVFAPRYRQAHLHAYMTKDKTSAKAAFEKAYDDVEAAFLYYLNHENEGRPFIIASHSQGTTHGAPLIKKHIDGQPLQDQLIAAYLVGMPMLKDYFKNIEPCEDEGDVNCFASWRTYRRGTIPKTWAGDQFLATNPLSWKIDGSYADASQNNGSVFRKFDKVYEGRVDAQAHEGFIWTNRPKFPWSFLFTTKNYHIADFNFFYQNVQENAMHRASEFMKQKKS